MTDLSERLKNVLEFDEQFNQEHDRLKPLLLALVGVYESTLTTYHGSQMKEDCAICQSLAAVVRELEKIEGE